MGILRSETMNHGLVVLPVDRARHIINVLGHCAPIQFTDGNDGQLQGRPFRKYVQRVDTSLRLANRIISDIEKMNPDDPNIIVKSRIDSFLHRDLKGEVQKYDDVEQSIGKLSAQFDFFRKNNEGLEAEINSSEEERQVLKFAKTTLGMSSLKTGRSQQSDAHASLLANEGGVKDIGEMTFSNVAGVCLASDAQRIARQVFRVTRGNTYTIFEIIPEEFWDSKSEKHVKKAVFSIYFQGAVSSAMGERVQRICQASGATLHEWATSGADAERRLNAVESSIADKKNAMKAYRMRMAEETSFLTRLIADDGNSFIEETRLFLEKEKAIYSTMNLFEVTGSTMRAHGWYPENDQEAIQSCLAEEGKGSPTSGLLVEDRAKSQPPTYIRRNEFTDAFQELIDTYGCPGYKEANPALLACMTFPFLFGVMYGDVFHGGCLFMVACWACMNAESLKYGSEAQKALYFARYLLLLMGFFAVYACFIYNDFLSLGVNLFPSRYVEGVRGDKTVEMLPDFDTVNEGGRGPYPFGLDPAWHGASNELLFVNSFKMKLSVLVGVSQMTMGVFLRFSNAVYNGNKTDFFFECVPMLIFMVCFFGYMDFMILYKWLYPTATNPSLINSMISMGLGQPDDHILYPSQMATQGTLIKFVALSVPLLLIPKPAILYMQNKNKGKVAVEDEEACHDAHGHGEFDMAEIVIHQVIETIEYVLGTVSHTASYLRLWALSLAHQQLSSVFFSKTMCMALDNGSPIAIYCGFACLMAVTAAVLLGMDVLECFLHTLRLHWVEFQSKFFKADGHAFAPFKHDILLKDI